MLCSPHVVFYFFLLIALLMPVYSQCQTNKAAFQAFKEGKKAYADKNYAQAAAYFLLVKQLDSGRTNAYLEYLLINSYAGQGDYVLCKEEIEVYYTTLDTTGHMLTPKIKTLERSCNAGLAKDLAAYQKAYAEQTSQALQSYLDDFPFAAYRKLALIYIDNIDYNEATTANTEAAYIKYLGLHPSGDHATQVRRGLYNMVVQLNAKHNELIKSYNKESGSHYRKGAVFLTLAAAVGAGIIYVWTDNKLDETTQIILGSAPSAPFIIFTTLGIVHLSQGGSSHHNALKEKGLLRSNPYISMRSPGSSHIGPHVGLSFSFTF